MGTGLFLRWNDRSGLFSTSFLKGNVQYAHPTKLGLDCFLHCRMTNFVVECLSATYVPSGTNSDLTYQFLATGNRYGM